MKRLIFRSFIHIVSFMSSIEYLPNSSILAFRLVSLLVCGRLMSEFGEYPFLARLTLSIFFCHTSTLGLYALHRMSIDSSFTADTISDSSFPTFLICFVSYVQTLLLAIVCAVSISIDAVILSGTSLLTSAPFSFICSSIIFFIS